MMLLNNIKHEIEYIFTTRKRSCRKVMYSYVSVDKERGSHVAKPPLHWCWDLVVKHLQSVQAAVYIQLECFLVGGSLESP